MLVLCLQTWRRPWRCCWTTSCSGSASSSPRWRTSTTAQEITWPMALAPSRQAPETQKKWTWQVCVGYFYFSVCLEMAGVVWAWTVVAQKLRPLAEIFLFGAIFLSIWTTQNLPLTYGLWFNEAICSQTVVFVFLHHHDSRNIKMTLINNLHTLEVLAYYALRCKWLLKDPHLWSVCLYLVVVYKKSVSFWSWHVSSRVTLMLDSEPWQKQNNYHLQNRKIILKGIQAIKNASQLCSDTS